MDINNVVEVGRLTRDPEMGYTNQQTPYCRFSIAVNGMKQDDVSYFDITAWNKTATSCGQYLKKGSRVGITGRLHQNRFTDKAGQNRSKIEIVANNVQFLTDNTGGSTGGNQQQGGNWSQPGNVPTPQPPADISIPAEFIAPNAPEGDGVPF
jgi:single-strand DNA-binding protein